MGRRPTQRAARVVRSTALRLAPHQATGEFLSEYDALAALLDLGEASVTWYMLEDAVTMVNGFRPDRVTLKHLPGSDVEASLTKKRGRAIAMHPPRPAVAALAPAVEDAVGPGDSGGESEAEDGAASEPDVAEDVEREGVLMEALEISEPLAEGGILDDAPPAPVPEAEPEVAAEAPDAVAEAEEPPEAEPAPPPLPPPALPDGVAERRPRKGARATLWFFSGTISYYDSKNAFEAVCSKHKQCVATRTNRSKAVGADGLPLRGRPVGVLAEWLRLAPNFGTKEEHWLHFDNAMADRSAARAQVAESESGRDLLACERERVDGEPEEPIDIGGYLP